MRTLIALLLVLIARGGEAQAVRVISVDPITDTRSVLVLVPSEDLQVDLMVSCLRGPRCCQ